MTFAEDEIAELKRCCKAVRVAEEGGYTYLLEVNPLDETHIGVIDLAFG